MIARDSHYRLVTLLDLLEFKAEAYWRLSGIVGQLIVRLETGIPPAKQIGNMLGELREEVEKLGVRSAVAQIDRINDVFTGGKWDSVQELANLLRPLVVDLHLRTADELGDRFFLVMPPEAAQFYNQEEPLFGKDVDLKFPAASFDISEAGKCHALNRDTACVFHLMRTVEVGIDGVRKCLGIPDPVKQAERNWGAILRKLGHEFDRRKTTEVPMWAHPKDADFFAEVYVSLDAIRNVWRNATMHVEKKYTSQVARHIHQAVQGFMRKLASRLDEEGLPLA